MTPAHDAESVVAWLRKTGTRSVRDGMARYAIPSDRAFGVPVGTLKKQAKVIGQSHALAAALWATRWYEARLLAAWVDDPKMVTPGQMDRWCREFDNWAVCDHICFILFDKTPHALTKVPQWARRLPEFERRAAWALLASVALHDKSIPDDAFVKLLPLMEQGAADERNFVKKGLIWAMRGVGGRSPALRKKVLELAGRLAESSEAAPRSTGKEVVRELRKKAG